MGRSNLENSTYNGNFHIYNIGINTKYLLSVFHVLRTRLGTLHGISY